MTPWTGALQAPLSIEFSRQEYWSGLPFPSPGDLPDPGIEPRFPTLQEDSTIWARETHFFVTSGDADHCFFFSLLPLIKLLSYFYRLRVSGIELCSIQNSVLLPLCSVVIYYLKYIMTWQWRRKWQPTLVFLPGKNPWTEKPDGLQSMGSPNCWTWLSHLSNNKMACQNEKNFHFFSKTSSPSNAYL